MLKIDKKLRKLDNKIMQNRHISKRNQSGQVAVMVVLIVVIMLTVGLSLASRTTRDVRLSQQQAESTKVFNAAETGAEVALAYDFSTVTDTVSLPPESVSIDGVSVETTITPTNTLETIITQGEAMEVDLTGYAGSTLTIDWSKATSCEDSAGIIASIFYTQAGVTKVAHHAFTPNGCSSPNRTSDEFEQVGTAGTAPYYRKFAIPIPNGAGITPLFVRLKSVYKDAPIKIAAASLPHQMYSIRAKATNDQGAETRTVEVQRSLSTAPSFMDYAVYSGGDLIK